MRAYGWRLVLGLIAVPAVAAFLVACGGGGDGDASPTPGETATPTSETPGTASPGASATTPPPTVTLTPPPEDGSPAGFRAFAADLDAALRRGEVDFVVARLKTVEYTCRAEDVPQQLGGPACETVGQQFRGFVVGRWRSEGGLVPVETVVAQLQSLRENLQDGATDAFGPGLLRVYALGGRNTTVITALINRPEGFAPGGPLRIVLVPSWVYENGRWMAASQLSAYVLAEDFLRPSDEGRAYLDGVWERFGESSGGVDREQEIERAAAEAVTLFSDARATPDCVPEAPCIEHEDGGPSVDRGILQLSYRGAAGDPGGAALVMGRTPAGEWKFWFATQNTTYRLLVLPGELMVCADGDGLNVRESPNTSARVVGFLPNDGDRMQAVEFRLTEPGTREQAGYGWYRVEYEAASGWVYSKYVSTAAEGSCAARDAIEKD